MEQMDITAILRSYLCWVLPKTNEIPGEFQQKEQHKKKIAVSTPFRGEMPGKTQVSHVQNGPGLHSIEVKMATMGTRMGQAWKPALAWSTISLTAHRTS
jgi:hypothetical protein